MNVNSRSLSNIFRGDGLKSGYPFSSPEDLPDPETEPGSPALQADSLPSEPPGKLLLINERK